MLVTCVVTSPDGSTVTGRGADEHEAILDALEQVKQDER